MLDHTSGPRSSLSCHSRFLPHAFSVQSFTLQLLWIQVLVTSSCSCLHWFWSTMPPVVTHWSSQLHSVTNSWLSPWHQYWLFHSCFLLVSSYRRHQFQCSWKSSSTCLSSSMATKHSWWTNSQTIATSHALRMVATSSAAMVPTHWARSARKRDFLCPWDALVACMYSATSFPGCFYGAWAAASTESH